MSDSDINDLRNIGGFSIDGWIAEKIEGKTNNIVQPVVFISREEFGELILHCKKVSFGGTASMRRSDLKEALEKECRSVLGDERIDVESKTLNDVWMILLGIPFNYKDNTINIGNIRLKDITNPSIFPDSQFDSFRDNFKTKFEKIKQYVNSDYPIYVETNGIKYYWIPLEDLP
jgi:hypothetical protein